MHGQRMIWEALISLIHSCAGVFLSFCSCARADGLPEGAVHPAAVFARVWVHANCHLIHVYQCGSWSWRMAPGVRGENKPTRGGKTVRAAWESVLVRCVNRRVTRDAERGDRTDQSPDGSTLKRAQVEIGLNRREINKGHVAELFLSVFSRKFGNESLCIILKRALNTFDACGFFTLAFRLFKKLLTVQRHRLDSPSALFPFILRCMN